MNLLCMKTTLQPLVDWQLCISQTVCLAEVLEHTASCNGATLQGLVLPLAIPLCLDLPSPLLPSAAHAAALQAALPHAAAAAWARSQAVTQPAIQRVRPTCRACASRWNFLSFLFLAISLARCVFL